MEVGLGESRLSPCPDFRVSFGKQLAAQFKLPRIECIGAEPRIKVLCVVGVELTLNDDFRGCVLGHGIPLCDSNVNYIQLVIWLSA